MGLMSLNTSENGMTHSLNLRCVMPIGTWRCTDMEIDLER